MAISYKFLCIESGRSFERSLLVSVKSKHIDVLCEHINMFRFDVYRRLECASPLAPELRAFGLILTDCEFSRIRRRHLLTGVRIKLAQMISSSIIFFNTSVTTIPLVNRIFVHPSLPRHSSAYHIDF